MADDSNSGIQPCDINTNRHFLSAFGKYQAEVAAHYIVIFCKQREGWVSFTEQEVLDSVNGSERQDAYFSNLEEGGFIVRAVDNRLYVTDEFIKRCYKASPA